MKDNLIFKTTKQDLYNKGFHYNSLLSDDHEDWFTLKFPVLFYKNKPTVECEIAVEPESGICVINVFNANTREIYVPYYNHDFGRYITIKIIEKKISNKLKALGIEV